MNSGPSQIQVQWCLDRIEECGIQLFVLQPVKMTEN